MPIIKTTKQRAASKKRDDSTNVKKAQGRQRDSSQHPRADSRPSTRSSFTAPPSNEERPTSATAPSSQSRGSSSQPTKRQKASSAGSQQQAGKGRPMATSPRTAGEAGVSAFAATDPTRRRTTAMNGLESNGAMNGNNYTNPLFASHYSSQVHPSSAKSANGRRSTTSRAARGVSTMVAVVRLQRAARVFLMRRALRHIPRAAGERNAFDERTSASQAGANNDENEEGERELCTSPFPILEVPEPSPATESRMLRRIRAELHRTEQLHSLRTLIARRTLISALRAWVHRCRAKANRLSAHATWSGDADGSAGSACYDATDVRIDGAACTIQAALRARQSRVTVATIGACRRSHIAAAAIQRAWRRSPLYSAYVCRMHDRHACELLHRQEAVERRDLLRRHLVFLVRSHQQLYNHPSMWEAGLAIRRLPLYTADGLFLSGQAASYLSESQQLSAASAANTVEAIDKDAATFSPPATIPALIRSAGAFLSLTAQSSAAGAARGSDLDGLKDVHGNSGERYTGGVHEWPDNQLDVDAALRHCQYRLFFSPEDRRLLEDELQTSPVPPPSMSAAETKLSTATVSWQPPQRSPPLPDCEDEAPPYASAFASALTFLRQPRAVDPTMQHVLRQLGDVRNDPIQLLRVLRTHGHLPPELVAPLTCYGLHFQRVARGEEDQAVLSSTAVLQMCRPCVVGVPADPAEELRNCLVGAVVGAGGGADRGLPLPLAEYKCRRESALRSSGVCGSMWQQRAAPATLQRKGFANSATQALFHGGESAAPHVDVTAAVDGGLREHTSVDGGNSSVHWDHRLASGVGEVGAEWRQFLLSIPTSSSCSSFSCSSPHGQTMTVEAETNWGVAGTLPGAVTHLSPSAPPTRRFVGLSSHLVAAASSSSRAPVLLRSFEPATAAHATTTTPTPTTPLAVSLPPTAASSLRPDNAPPLMRKAQQQQKQRQQSTTGAAGGGAQLVSNVLRMEEWWDAVERLLVQERVKRLAAEHNESEQRRSIRFLRRLASPAAATPA